MAFARNRGKTQISDLHVCIEFNNSTKLCSCKQNKMTHGPLWVKQYVGWCETLGVPVSQLIGTMYGRDCSIIIREALIILPKQLAL